MRGGLHVQAAFAVGWPNPEVTNEQDDRYGGGCRALRGGDDCIRPDGADDAAPDHAADDADNARADDARHPAIRRDSGESLDGAGSVNAWNHGAGPRADDAAGANRIHRSRAVLADR